MKDSMDVAVTRNTLVVRFRERFALAEAARVEEELSALDVVSLDGVSQVTLDFREVREFEDAAIVPLAGCLRRFGVRIHTRGLTIHEERMLAYLGVPRDPNARAIPVGDDDDDELPVEAGRKP